ncbi:tRNA (cytidine-2'-O-)-methyltransferase TrmJ [Sulfurisphaera javensis]|uniref:tRNA (Cytidine-2'-O-)-methyltransferase TrmJ n=1 Tax=Sulfurisphaera javensis TaxID=2049879 RepID=A0AAT9GRV6_9CREN
MIRLVIVEPEGSYNVGFISRLAKNFLVDELYIVNPHCDLEEAKRFSAKGIEYLERAKIVNSFDEAIKDVDLKIATSSIADNRGDILRKSIRPWELPKLIEGKRIALIFGRESVGLTREEIAKSDLLLFIPGNPEYPVLNLSHAVGIVLYEIWKSKGENRPTVSSESISLIDKYSRDLVNLIKNNEEDEAMYIALKRALIKGVLDEEEARTVIRLLRKLYVKLTKKFE